MGLSFITPLLLGGASLVAIPVVLHLVMRRKPVPHVFPALRFLRERAVVNRRRLRLTHLLLLALRMAAVTLVALALARPVVRGAGWIGDREGPVAAAFVFDTAPRMGVREANTTRLQKAVALARTLFGKLPDASRVAVVDTAGGAAAFLPSPAAAAARIERLAPGPQAVPLPAAIATARRLLAESPLARRELYVFTDCSHGAWDNAPPQPESGADGITPLFVDVAADAVDDCAIASLKREMRSTNPLSSTGSIDGGLAPPESRPMTSRIDQPMSTASFRAAMAARSGLGAFDHAGGIPEAFAAWRAAAKASACGDPASTLRPDGDVSCMCAIAPLNRCKAARGRSANGPPMPVSVVATATKRAACRHRCGA